MNPLYKLFGGGAVLVAGLVWLLPGQRPAGDPAPSITLYCAAGLREPVEEIAERFEEEHGTRVDIQYGGSGTLLSQLEVAQTGDLYLAADDSYLSIARDKGLVRETLAVARVTAVVAMKREAAARVTSLDDLLSLRIAAANPDQAAVGNLLRAKLQAAGRWADFDAAVRKRGVYKPTVGDVAGDVALGAVDAGVVWDAVAGQYPNLKAVSLPELKAASATVGVGVLERSTAPTMASRFARYLVAPARGAAVLHNSGYRPAR